MNASTYGFTFDAEARAFALCLVRVLATLGPLPVFGQGVSARFSKLGLGAVLAYLAWRSTGATAVDPGASAVGLLFAVLGETLFGLMLGFTARLALDVCRIAGDLVSHEMGLNLAHQMDPASGQSVPLIGHIYESVGLVLFFALGAHHALLGALFRSFRGLAPGETASFERLLPTLVGFGGGLLEAALRLAAPAFFALLLMAVVLAFLAKVAPQWRLIDAGYPLRAGVGLSMIALGAPVYLPLVNGAFDLMRERLDRIVAPI